MADITKNPPKQEITPGQAIDSRKTGDKKVVEELQEFNTQTKELAADAKTGFRAIVEGIKAGNAEMNPEKAIKTQISGFKELTDAQQNVVDIFGNMKDSTERSQAGMAKDMSIEKGSKLENQKEQFGLWERMLLRLVGIDEDLDKLIQNTTPRPEEKGWLGKIFTGLILGAITGFVAGMVFGFSEVLLLYAKMLVKAVKFVGGKFINSKFMAPLVNPIKNFFKSIGKRIGNMGKNTKGFLKPFTKGIKDIGRQFAKGFSGTKGAVATSKGFLKQNIIAKIGKLFGSISKMFKAFWKPISGFMATTKTLGAQVSIVGKAGAGSAKAFGGFFSGIRGFFRGLGLIFKPMTFAFKFAFGIFAKFGRVFGRFFLPLTIIMGLVDGVKGFIDGFKNTEGGMFSKIIGGLIGGVKGIVNGLIMMPLDMLKSAVAWILGKFGFDGMAEGLKGFSFQEMFSSFVDMFTNTLWAVVDWFKLLFSDPGQALKNLASGMVNLLLNYYKAIVRMILPDPKGGKWYNPLSMIQKIIPDSVYEWADMDPNTGERLEDVVKEEAVPLQPTPETKSTMSRWGDNISGWWNKEDPVTEMQMPGLVPTFAPTGGLNVLKEGDVDVSQQIINITGDMGGGQTKEKLRKQ